MVYLNLMIPKEAALRVLLSFFGSQKTSHSNTMGFLKLSRDHPLQGGTAAYFLRTFRP